MKRSWVRHASVLSALWVTAMFSALSGAGCESTTASYCVARCDCQGCSEREREDCIDDIEDSERLAEFDECAAEFSNYVSCYGDEGMCTNDAWVSSTCTAYGTVLRGCSSRAAKFVKSACAEERDKRERCGLFGGGSDPCAGAEECAALCALSASCEDLSNPMSGSTYVDCVIGCSDSGSSSNSVGSGGGVGGAGGSSGTGP